MLAFIVLFSTALNAQIIFDGSPETDAPPPTLGGFTMVPFEEDTRPTGAFYPDVPLPAPYTGVLGFTPDLRHSKIGDGWQTWSHGYTGSVYSTAGVDITSRTLTLPPETRAFYFYAQPNIFSVFNIEAIGEAGSRSSVSSGPIPVDGSGGAKYFGFYTDGFEEIPQIVVPAQDGAEGIAVGEFGIFVGPVSEPVPISSFALYLGLLLMVTFGAYRLRRII